jgi:hypothetical protein
MKDKALAIIRNIGDWYLMEHGTYIRIYGATKAPHLLPRFVLDKLVLQEVSYQTMIHGVRTNSLSGQEGYMASASIMDWFILIQPPSRLRMKWIHYYRTTSGKKDSEGMIPRRLSKIIAANSNSHGNIRQLFGMNKKCIVGHKPMMKSSSGIKETHGNNC